MHHRPHPLDSRGPHTCRERQLHGVQGLGRPADDGQGDHILSRVNLTTPTLQKREALRGSSASSLRESWGSTLASCVNKGRAHSDVRLCVCRRRALRRPLTADDVTAQYGVSSRYN